MQNQHPQDADTLAWLLEADTPGVRYLALRDLLDCPDGDSELAAARTAAHREGPIAEILAHMNPDGYWFKPGPGYGPKYRATVWPMISLGQLGASVAEDERVAKACAYVMEHALAPGGQFTYSGAPDGTIDCLQGNLCGALTALGCDDPRLEKAYEWMARTVTGEGLAPASARKEAARYYRYKCGPLFACRPNDQQPCAWGAVKVMAAFSRLPEQRRTPLIRRAVEQGAEYLLNGDPARAGYYNSRVDEPSPRWWEFTFPVFYVTDILQNVETLVGLGYGQDPRLAGALDVVREKRDRQARWALDYNYGSKTWGSFGRKGDPNKWVTLRAMRVLKAVDGCL